MKTRYKIFAALFCLLVGGIAGAQYSSTNYRETGGSRWVIGGSLDVASGGDLDIESGGALKIAGTAVTASAAELNTVDGGVARATLIQDDLAAYRVPFATFWENGGVATISGNADAGGTAAGTHYLTESAGVIKLFGNSPSSTTETDVSVFEWSLPPEYVDGETVTLRINGLYTTIGDTQTVDAVVYEVAAAGTVGSDICATAAQTLTASAANYDFTITPSGLVAGDMLAVEITTVFQDADGSVGEAQINSVQFLLDVKG